ncbi:hypothetical protein B0X43_07615 [Helicobacter pylori]|nr:hypothetical protein B0X43_07615 [Helicobacter pylori]
MIRLFGNHHLNLKGLNFIQFEILEYKTKILIACKLGGGQNKYFRSIGALIQGSCYHIKQNLKSFPTFNQSIFCNCGHY